MKVTLRVTSLIIFV